MEIKMSAISYETILFEKKGNIVKLTLNRPEKLNAVNLKTLSELEDAMYKTAYDEDIKVLIVTGAGRGFCSGFDLTEGIDFNNAIPFAQRIMERVTKVVLGFTQIPKLIIAAVNGPAIGLGLGLVLTADISIASEEAMFSTPFVLRGLHPDTATTYFLPKIVGLTRARELLLTGKAISAKEAGNLGIVNRVVTSDKLQAEVAKIAQDWATGPQIALTMAKSSIYQMLPLDLASALELEARAQCECFATKDIKEALEAWKGKRQPIFNGR
ncbi:enoyl-CoA hydratase/isomerase family protein [Chloroflexota bacterium]